MKNLAMAVNMKRHTMKKKMAHGGMSESEMEPHDMSMADMIMMRRKAKKMMMADGGEVDLDENAMEDPNPFEDINEDAALKENYDADMDSLHEPMDSNEHGQELHDEDDEDMVSAVRKRMKMKSMMK